MHIKRRWKKGSWVVGGAVLILLGVSTVTIPKLPRMASHRGFDRLVASVIGALGNGTLTAQQLPDRATIERGQVVYQKYGCFVCHGIGGGGGVRNKNAITAEQVAGLIKVSEGYTPKELRQKILEGTLIIQKKDPKGSVPPLSMPTFRGSEEELSDLLAYVMSLETPPSEVPTTRPPVPAFMVGEGNCRVCHEAVVKRFESNIHAKAWPDEESRTNIAMTCAKCHGNGDRHAQNPSDPRTLIRFNDTSSASIHDKNAACLACHEKGLRFSWRGSTHESKDMTCTACHKIMEPTSDRRLLAKQQEMEVCFQCHQVRRAQLQRTSHMPLREAKVTCTDCHNPHGTTAEKLLSADSVNETCYKCHAEKRGPFLWEHPPVAESCLNCHEPHGSNHASLLKSERPRLCQRCHIETRHPTTPQIAASRFVFNRSCQNCHSQIHGSNHPSGVRFQR